MLQVNKFTTKIITSPTRTLFTRKTIHFSKSNPIPFQRYFFQITPVRYNQANVQEQQIPIPINETIVKNNNHNDQPNDQEKEYSKLKIFALTTGIGIAMGIFGGMVGLGGGVIAIPLLVNVLKLSQHTAHATTLAAITSTGLVGASVYYIYGNGAVDIFAAATIATTAIIMVPLGIKYCKTRSSKQLKFFAGLFTFSSAIIIALKEIYERYFKKPSGNESADENDFGDIHKLPNESYTEMIKRRAAHKDTALFFGSGMITGFVSGLLGVGGGLVLLPLLSAFTTMPQQLVFGTVLLSMVPITLTGTLTHLGHGTILLRAIPGLFIGSSIGAVIGGRISIHLNQTQQRGVVVVILGLLGLRQMM